MAASGTLSILVICGVGLVMLAMLGFVIYAARKEKAQKEQFATELGFAPVTETQDLLERLAAVNEHSRPGMLYLTHVFRRSAAGGQVYWYSLSRSRYESRQRGKHGSGSHYTSIESEAFAFVTSAWNLPGFKATPRFEGEGKLAALANQLAEKVVDAFANRIELPHIPGLDDKYFIASMPGFDSSASPMDLPETFWRTLAANPGLNLHAGGDTFTVSLASTLDRDEEKIRQLYKTALQLARELQTG